MHAFIGPLTPCVGAVSRGTTPAASSFAYRGAKRPYLYPQRAAAAAGGRAARKPQAAPTRMSLASSLVAVQQQQPQQFLLAGEAGGMSVQFPAYLVSAVSRVDTLPRMRVGDGQ